MKLLFCPDCWDVFKLETSEVRKCKCGKCAGRYEQDEHHAITNGEGVCLAFNNYTLQMAIAKYALIKDKGEVTQNHTGFLGFNAWVRDHSGDSNPRTRVDPQLGNESNA